MPKPAITTSVTERDNPQGYFAALDIGSNSFHFVLARKIGEQLQIMHSEKYRVKLAQGLDKENNLSNEAIVRAIKTLGNLASSAEHINRKNFRVVATHSLRQAKNIERFLQNAAKVFPYDIEIISGHEEARLIYQGVAYHNENTKQQLVIDIGGGSTECIIGQQHEIITLASLSIGCVSYTKSYFADGVISDKAFNKAIRAAKHEIDSILKRFKQANWQQAVGTSGTLKNIYKILNDDQVLHQPFTLKQLLKLKKNIVAYRHCNDLKIKGLKKNRHELICAGVAITIALMECLEISAIGYSQYALREGVLFEQLEDISNHTLGNNTRQRTVDNLAMRFNVDQVQVKIIQRLLNTWLKKIENKWELSSPIYTELLMFAVKLHELGIDINSSGYQKHGQYILTHSDLAGFNQEQQQALAWLVGNQRKKITPLKKYYWHLLSSNHLLKLCGLLRLAILLCQQRQSDEFLPAISIDVFGQSLILSIDQQWLLNRPIVDTELFYEQAAIIELGIDLKIDIDIDMDSDSDSTEGN